MGGIVFAQMEDSEFYNTMIIESLQVQCVSSSIQYATITANGNDGTLAVDVAYTPLSSFLTQTVTVSLI